ncbi:zinc finger, C3HC4 type (RING finger) protein (macronuclear) [Tetrahymena thermophila SB210]|uniref:Zinc finger, C3HC4 type (RING finger) protein n=1 Tax=Tetrahymena thermophila (strain SB210) TaxID=312017 RepID=I7LUI0_TETTS|nr:zinc finger, C3HC4 type (RING finger) protein [Tetrahymena thermophila SB210]EAR93811.2 zinc finger, C3HC4 type (RING finger) protein [Tetrahymena thermophila SB210]|eukprot:XP_001014056.2 zinc finger, C3HC4 type (RING finger) protein [Tetrahymena thermophila SB210]
MNKILFIPDQQNKNLEENFQNLKQFIHPKKETIYQLLLLNSENIDKNQLENINLQKSSFFIQFQYKKKQNNNNNNKSIIVFNEKYIEQTFLTEEDMGNGIYQSNYKVNIWNVILRKQEKLILVAIFSFDQDIINVKVALKIQQDKVFDLLCFFGFLLIIYKFVKYCQEKFQQNLNNNLQQNQSMQSRNRQQIKSLQDEALDTLIYNQLQSCKAIEMVETQQNQQECSICLEQYQAQDEVYKLQCGHIFHKNCINLWFKKKNYCPIDRIKILHHNSIVACS